ncbi:hypothetical protein J2T60_000487 [Natronospira proteinivora]|uniref:HNH endonuclease n=1 Tax=Natronospira proteinivora TaxID=1807133 RepID=A0ABT1G612_9GAMM|nr:hypothetical protein [Natronospira proteinivora]MCP1726522.1 hypothetical protein [Natronospira proteinivora]
MTKIAFQSAADSDSRENLEKTLLNPVVLSELESIRGTGIAEELANIYPGDMARVGAVKQGKEGEQKAEWEKLQRGDVVLFMRDDMVFLSGIVTYLVKNPDLARELWGDDERGHTPECVYFVDEVKDQFIPCSTINRMMGLEETYPWPGFQVHLEDVSAPVVYGYQLESHVYFPIVSEDEYKEIVQEIDRTRPLDTKGWSRLRKEDGFLRDQLFRGKVVEECGICGNKYPTQFLIAAHIKDRWHCTTEDRLDYQNIAMPICKLGCEELYRRNYVTVIDERVAVTKARVDSKDLKSILVRLQGRVCPWFKGSRKYFDWHTRLGKYF